MPSNAQPKAQPGLNLVPKVLSYWEPGLSRNASLCPSLYLQLVMLYKVRLHMNRP